MLLWIYFFGDINDEFNGPYCLFALGIQEVLSMLKQSYPGICIKKIFHTGLLHL